MSGIDAVGSRSSPLGWPSPGAVEGQQGTEELQDAERLKKLNQKKGWNLFRDSHRKADKSLRQMQKMLEMHASWDSAEEREKEREAETEEEAELRMAMDEDLRTPIEIKLQ